MSNLSRTIRRNKARLLIGEYEARKNKKKKRKNKNAVMIVPGNSKTLTEFWRKIQIDAYGYWSWRMNRIACDPKQRRGAVIFPVQNAGRR
jgi:hypothetical protein